MNLARSVFGQFMASAAGRILRIVAGVVLIALGFRLGDIAGIVIALIGAVPLLAGIFDVCVISALVGGPLSGARIRELGHPATLRRGA